MLRAEEFGRLAFRLVDEVHITPVNYAVDGETLLFRTAEGSKLLGVVMGSDVAFEIDHYGEDTARSVVIRGRARLLPEDAHTLQRLLPVSRGITSAASAGLPVRQGRGLTRARRSATSATASRPRSTRQGSSVTVWSGAPR